MKPKSKRYLGDAVYAEVTQYGLKLTTENGIEKTNEIYLEDEVWNALDEYMKDRE